MNGRVDDENDCCELVPLRETGRQSKCGGKRKLCRVMLETVDDTGYEDVEDQKFQDDVRDRQSSQGFGARLDADQSLQQRRNRATSLVEMEQHRDHEQHAEDHVDRDAVTQIDQREQ